MKPWPHCEADALRGLAAKCRRLSAGAVPQSVSSELETIATEYESRARRLETGPQHAGDDPSVEHLHDRIAAKRVRAGTRG